MVGFCGPEASLPLDAVDPLGGIDLDGRTANPGAARAAGVAVGLTALMSGRRATSSTWPHGGDRPRRWGADVQPATSSDDPQSA
jgi:hypothetical protein